MGMMWPDGPTAPAEPRAVLGSGEPRKSTPVWVSYLSATGCVLVCVLILVLSTIGTSK
jgi:hypothetical protein